MMVVGYAGIGKSVLVNEVHKYIIARNGYFISGKFNQFERNIPYFGLIQALQQLIRQIVTEKRESIDSWKERITNAVGPNGQLIIDVIPEVEMKIGKQPPVPELPSQESQNRFNLYFQNFIKAFSSQKQPLIIFLDDIQWADLPSLKTIKFLMSDTGTRYLLLIGAYRNNEVEANHPLLKTLDDIKGSGTYAGTLNLPSLDYENTNHCRNKTLEQKVIDRIRKIELQNREIVCRLAYNTTMKNHLQTGRYN
jgi:predicted ATPase